MAYSLASRLERAVKNSGLKYKKVSGWASRGHGTMGSIQTIVAHHTAGPKSGNTPSLNVVTYGRPGLSGPLAQLFLARDGTVYLCAAGIAYHAGRVRSSSYSNSHSIGIEAENTGLSNDPWPSHQVDAYAKLCKALCKEFGLSTSRVLGHKEVCSPAGRKSDPSFNMGAFRKKVGGAKGGVGSSLGTTGGGGGGKYESASAKHAVGSRAMGMYDGGTDVNWLQRRMYKIGYTITPKKDGTFDSLFGNELKTAVGKLQDKAKLKKDYLAGKDTIAAAKAAKVVRQLPTVKKTSTKKKPAAKLAVDGVMGVATKKALQRALKVTADGIVGKNTVKALQRKMGAAVDGKWGRDTTRKLQKKLKVKADGAMGPITVKALQRALNEGRF